MITFVLLALAAIVCMPRREGLAAYMRNAIGRARLREYAAKIAAESRVLSPRHSAAAYANRALQHAVVRDAEVRLQALADMLPSEPDNDNAEPTIPRAPRLPCFEIPPPANRESA